jgi:hypothetical protein
MRSPFIKINKNYEICKEKKCIFPSLKNNTCFIHLKMKCNVDKCDDFAKIHTSSNFLLCENHFKGYIF